MSGTILSKSIACTKSWTAETDLGKLREQNEVLLGLNLWTDWAILSSRLIWARPDIRDRVRQNSCLSTEEANATSYSRAYSPALPVGKAQSASSPYFECECKTVSQVIGRIYASFFLQKLAVLASRKEEKAPDLSIHRKEFTVAMRRTGLIALVEMTLAVGLRDQADFLWDISTNAPYDYISPLGDGALVAEVFMRAAPIVGMPLRAGDVPPEHIGVPLLQVRLMVPKGISATPAVIARDMRLEDAHRSDAQGVEAPGDESPRGPAMPYITSIQHTVKLVMSAPSARPALKKQ